MSRTLERYLKMVRGPAPDVEALAAMETAFAEKRDWTSLKEALKTRLTTLEERDGPQPISLSLRKKLADALMSQAGEAAEDERAVESACEAVEIFAHALNDVDGLKAAVILALSRGSQDAAVRHMAKEKLGGGEYVLKAIKRALKEVPPGVRKAGLAHAAGCLREEDGDRAGALPDFIRAARWEPDRRVFVDELMRTALEQDRHQEAEAALAELARDEGNAMAPATRAYVLSKVGTLRAHLGDDKGALEAFERALQQDPSLKAAAKQARRLAEKLGVEITLPPMPETPAAPPEPVAAGEPVPANTVLDATPLPDDSLTPAPEPAPFLIERTGTALLGDLPRDEIARLAAEAVQPAVLETAALEETLRAPSPADTPDGSPWRRTVPLAEAEPVPRAPEPTPIAPAPVHPDPTPIAPPPLGVDDNERTEARSEIPEHTPTLQTDAPRFEATPAPSLLDPVVDKTTVNAPISESTEPEHSPPPPEPAAPPAVEAPPVEAEATTRSEAPAEVAAPARIPVVDEQTMVDSGTDRTPSPDEPPPAAEEDVQEAPAPPEPRTAEEFIRAGEPAKAVPLLLERFGAQGRVADLMLLADIHETALHAEAEAAQFWARAAQRLAERNDPRDIMLRRCVEGALRTGAGNPGALTHLADHSGTRLLPDDEVALARAVARAQLQDQPAGAAGRLQRVYERHPDLPAAAALYEDADRALALAGDRRGQAELRRLARTRSDDPRARAILSRERADLLKFDEPRLFAQALQDVLEDDPADGAALEKLLNTWETARQRGEPVTAEYADALMLAARLQKGEAGLPHLRRLARLREETFDRDGALRAWRDVLSRRPGDADALRLMTELLEGVQTDPERARDLVDILEMRIRIARNRGDTPTEAQLLPKLAAVMGRMGQEDARISLLRDALRVDPNNDTALQVVESYLSEHGGYGELAALFEDLATRRATAPGRIAALLSAAALHRERTGNLVRAQECLQDALRADPDNAGAMLVLADLAAEAGEVATAVAHLERASGLQKGQARAGTLTRLGALQEGPLGDVEAAARTYREALVSDPGHRAALEALLALAQRTGRGAEARAVAADLAAMEPDPARRADSFLGLARQAREGGEVDAAVRLYDTALTADPTRMDAVEELAWIHVQRSDGRRARTLVERLVAARGVDTVPPPLLVSLAKTQWASGENGPAKERLRAALRKDPGMLEALRALADLLLAGRDEDPQEILSVLEQRVLHHGEKLEKEELAFIHAQAGRIRVQTGDTAGATRSLRRALSLMPPDRPDPDALQALAKMTEQAGKLDEAQELYTRLARRLQGAAAAGQWFKVGQLARSRGDAEASAAAFQEARKLDPNRQDVAKALLEVEMARGNAGAAVQAMMDMLQREPDPARQSQLHLSLAKLQRETLANDEKAALHLRRALELEPANKEALALAEQIFLDKKDPRGLVGVYTSSIRNLPPDNTEGRVALWEKVALIRRYELRDLAGAVAALEEILKLDDGNAKAREDAARLYVELGTAEKALGCWRGILARDPLSVDAYRGMLAIFRRQLQFDAAYCVAATLVALEEADDEVRSIVRSLRPPFPTWPRPTTDADATVRRMLHPRARGPTQDLVAALAPHVTAVFSAPLAKAGLKARDEMDLDAAPPSFALAAKHAGRLLGLPKLTLVRGAEDSRGISLAVARELRALVVSPEALKGGMTPERAFSFARAAFYLRPENQLVAATTPVELRNLLEALALRAVPGADVEGNRSELEQLARDAERVVPATEWPRVILLARDWWRERTSQPVTEMLAALAFTADRVGFLFAQDLSAAVSVLRQQTGAVSSAGIRAAIRELVLFSVSPELFGLRQELGPSVNASAAARLFGEG